MSNMIRQYLIVRNIQGGLTAILGNNYLKMATYVLLRKFRK